MSAQTVSNDGDLIEAHVAKLIQHINQTCGYCANFTHTVTCSDIVDCIGSNTPIDCDDVEFSAIDIGLSDYLVDFRVAVIVPAVDDDSARYIRDETLVLVSNKLMRIYLVGWFPLNWEPVKDPVFPNWIIWALFAFLLVNKRKIMSWSALKRGSGTVLRSSKSA